MIGINMISKEEKKKRICSSGIRIVESEMFSGEWLFVVYDKDGDIFSSNGYPTETAVRSEITRIRKVFRNRFLSIKTEI